MIFISNYFIVFYSFVGTNDNNKSFVNFEAFMPYRILNGYIIPQASYLPKLNFQKLLVLFVPII